MCYRIECKACGKYSWGGCGKHLKSLYEGIENGKHCMCRSWPGVVITSQTAPKAIDQPLQSGIAPKGNENPKTLEVASGAALQ